MDNQRRRSLRTRIEIVLADKANEILYNGRSTWGPEDFYSDSAAYLRALEYELWHPSAAPRSAREIALSVQLTLDTRKEELPLFDAVWDEVGEELCDVGE